MRWWLSIYITWIAVYLLYGNPDSFSLSNLYMAIEYSSIAFLCLYFKQFIEKYSDMIMLVAVYKILQALFCVGCIIYPPLFESINRNTYIISTLILTLLITLIYDSRR